MAPSPAAHSTGASPRPSSKRPANALLPAFEPLSSSPALPRPLKRSRDVFDERLTYPTPVPTSSTAILSSSPPRASTAKLSAQRSLSALSERTPLGAVPSIELKADGKPTRLGRSSASCDYQLSANRLISRVHVSAYYKPAATRLERDRVEILCTGWNGIKIHCEGNVYELKKGETFSSDIRDAEIMLDVHDSRVVIHWPPKPHLGPISSDEEEKGEEGDVDDEEDESSPSKNKRVMLRHSTPPSPSPLQPRRRPASPVSPSPAVKALLPSSPPLPPLREPTEAVEIYEDPEPLSQESDKPDRPGAEMSQISPGLSSLSQTFDSTKTQDFSDNDEENDPIIHSFGPFGANLLPRMASFTAAESPKGSPSGKSSRSSRTTHTEPLQPNQSPAQPKSQAPEFDISSHIINQLAFSRLSSTPLSTILSHLPRDAGALSKDDLRILLRETACIGEVTREGKDAAGKPLESEYYYIPDLDEDEKRKEAVVNDLMKPGLRACRKQHKVCRSHSTLSNLVLTLIAILLAKAKMKSQTGHQSSIFQALLHDEAIRELASTIVCFIVSFSALWKSSAAFCIKHSVSSALHVRVLGEN